MKSHTGLDICCWLNVVLQSQCPKDRVQVTHPYAIRHLEKMISDFAELFETAVCFLHIPLTRTNVWLIPKMHPWWWFWVLKIVSKVWVLKTIHICVIVPRFPHDNVVWIHTWSTLWLVSQAWDVRSSNSCLVSSSSRQFVCKPLTILQQIRVLPAWIDDHPRKDLKLWRIAPLSCLPIRNIAQRIFEHVLPYPETNRNTWLKHLRIQFNDCFIRFPFTLSASQVYIVKTWCGVRQCPHVHHLFHMGAISCLLSNHFNVIHTCWQE